MVDRVSCDAEERCVIEEVEEVEEVEEGHCERRCNVARRRGNA